jgi:hypothetical protein
VALNTLGGQALGPGRHLAALLRYRLTPKLLGAPDAPARGGLVLDAVPPDRVADAESGAAAIETVLP